MDIREIDNEVHDVFVANFGDWQQFQKECSIPKTSLALLSFVTKINFLKEAILDLSDSENLYAINVVFRSLIEHHLRFQYIAMRILEEKSDLVGNDYLQFCALSEDIEYGKAWKSVAELLKQDSNKDPYQLLQQLNPNLKNLSKGEIEAKTKLFRYKEIAKFIRTRIGDNPFLTKLIPRYSELSSFVHGGPNSDKEVFNYTPEQRQKETSEIAELAVMISANAKSFSFLVLYQYDKKFGHPYNDIQTLMKKINELSPLS